jgi:hypothetical protein
MKRQREADERERVRLREQRRAERRVQRTQTDAPVEAPQAIAAIAAPILGTDGPRSLAELRAAQAAAPAEASDDDAGDPES